MSIKGWILKNLIKKGVEMSRVMLIKNDYIGERGELGSKLIINFLKALSQTSTTPSKIFLLNRGVLLSTQNEAGILALKALENKGVEIFSCYTCLEFFELLDHLKVGKVGNAKDTLEELLRAENAITL